jgi:ABC-2 type transport system permease protein
MMRRNLRFIWLLLKLELTNKMMFRANFFGGFFADGILFIMQLAAFGAVYSQTDSIGGWNRGQMLIFIGTFSLINALNIMIYFFGVLSIPGKIRDGTLDYYITKPVNPLLRLTFENTDPGSAPLLIFSALIIAYGVNVSGITVTAQVLLSYGVLVILMTLLWYDMEVILRTFAFFFYAVSDVDPIQRLENSLISLNFKIPGVIYRGFFKVLFYFVLPYGIMSTIPTQALTDELSPLGFCYAVFVAALFTAFTLWFWKFALRRYKSASS